MDLNKIPVFAAITKRMHWLNQRQRVLADNIANANTPGYRPSDLEEPSFNEELRKTSKMRMRATSPKHIMPATGSVSTDFTTRKQKDTYEMSPDGNAVVLEEQLMKVTETRMDYDVMTNLYRKHMGMLRTALGRGK